MRYPDLSTLGLSARTPEIPSVKYHDWTCRAALKRSLGHPDNDVARIWAHTCDISVE
jgi:hypothetical protein